MDAHQVVSRVQELAQQLDKVPTWREFLAAGNTEWTCKKHFSNYTALLAAAGLKTYKERRSQADETPPPLPEQCLSSSPAKPPRILLIDIETSTMLVEAYGLFDQNIPITKIARDWFLLSFAAGFVGEETVHYADLRDSPDYDDSMLLTAIHRLLYEADIVIGHNVRRFDLRKINARFLKHDIDPPTSYRIIDTLAIAKKHFALSSNKLDYLAKFLGCTPKYKSRKFTQEEMWQECLRGNVEAWQENETYNVQDKDTLEEVWLKLRKWDKSINWSIFNRGHKCECGSSELVESGEVHTNTGSFIRLLCAGCNKEFRDRENLLSPAIRRGIYK